MTNLQAARSYYGPVTDGRTETEIKTGNLKAVRIRVVCIVRQISNIQVQFIWHSVLGPVTQTPINR